MNAVEKVTLGNNQFAVKHRILREQSEQKFLLYHAGPPPADLDNWLLDVQLAYGDFRADQISLWLSEIGLGLEFADVVAPHTEFFLAARRRETLKSILAPDDTPRQVRLKMLAVCAGAEARLDDILENLLAELATVRDEKIRIIKRSALDQVLWEELERAFGYTSETAGIRDFAIELFKSCYAMGLGEESRLTNDALVFLKRWKDNVRHRETFEAISAECAGDPNIEQKLSQLPYDSLVDMDYFELIDRKILSDLVHDVANRTITTGDCALIIRLRRQSHWYENYKHPYEAIGHAADFFQALDDVDLTIHSMAQGIEQYCRVWYRLDQLYRQFIFHMRQSGQTTLLSPLWDRVENLYTNHYLLKVNDLWQPLVDTVATWSAPALLSQRDFYAYQVQPFLDRGNKVFVIISDALRFEIGEELLQLIRQEDRYDAELKPALTMVPSYTQLGMAALLPNQTLSVTDDAVAMVDEQSSQGTENRKKILELALPGKATAVRAKELLEMNREQSRALFRDHNVVYVYHNRIDAVGDKRDTEERVFDAAAATLDELVLIIKKLAGANVSNMLVTADHGFIYQHRQLDESDFASDEPQGAEILKRDRRFVLGKGLVESSSFKKFAAGEVGLTGDIEILIPKSINRLRKQGSGSRYVHGGTALQEIIIPVIQIKKKRQSDVTIVNVDILRGASSMITTGQLAVTLYQTEPTTAKVQPRTLRIGIYMQDGTLISDQHELVFDLAAEDPRQRETPVRFVLTSKADEANGQEVILRLEEQVTGTSHYREYKAARYLLRRSFTSDFDF